MPELEQKAAQLSELLGNVDDGIAILRTLAKHDTRDHIAANALAALRDARDYLEDTVCSIYDGILVAPTETREN